jgi:hypothetical protein
MHPRRMHVVSVVRPLDNQVYVYIPTPPRARTHTGAALYSTAVVGVKGLGAKP